MVLVIAPREDAGSLSFSDFGLEAELLERKNVFLFDLGEEPSPGGCRAPERAGQAILIGEQGFLIENAFLFEGSRIDYSHILLIQKAFGGFPC